MAVGTVISQVDGWGTSPHCSGSELTCEPGQRRANCRVSCHLPGQPSTGHTEVCGSQTGSEVGTRIQRSLSLVPLMTTVPPSQYQADTQQVLHLGSVFTCLSWAGQL